MAALNDNALWQFKWDLYIRPIAGWVWTDLWAVRWLISNIDWTNITEILSDNRWTLKKFTNLISNITVTCLEPQDRDKISLLFTSTDTNVAGTPVAVTWEVIQAWAVVVPAGTVYVIKNKSGDNAVVTSVTVDDNGTYSIKAEDYFEFLNKEYKIVDTVIDSNELNNFIEKYLEAEINKALD